MSGNLIVVQNPEQQILRFSFEYGAFAQSYLMANGIISLTYCWIRSAVKEKARIPESITIINNPFCVYDENGALPPSLTGLRLDAKIRFVGFQRSNAAIDGFHLEVMLYARGKRTDYNSFLNEK